ncbi:hypothetical protein ABG808_07630 [Streptococcus iniae]
MHCNYGSDGITENDYNYIWELNGTDLVKSCLEKVLQQVNKYNLHQYLTLSVSLMSMLA